VQFYSYFLQGSTGREIRLPPPDFPLSFIFHDSDFGCAVIILLLNDCYQRQPIMDALLDLFDADAKLKEPAASQCHADRCDNLVLEKENNRLTSKRGTSCENNTTLDPTSKIRIISRKISSAEQVDLLAPYQCHSSIAIASMNNQELASLVISKSASSTLGGKTNMATIGIVLSASGTRTSSKGASFIVITIGELHTGPALSILVFGDAYSTYTGKISNGQVIAVIASTILPPKAGAGETRITVTIRDKNQLQVIGISQDYGLCSGVDRRKVNGTFENIPCRMHIDRRSGCFCKNHNKPDHQKFDSKFKASQQKMSFLEYMKNDQRQVQRNQQALQSQHLVHPSMNMNPLQVNNQTPSLQRRGLFTVQPTEPCKDKLRSLLSKERAILPSTHDPTNAQRHESSQGTNITPMKPINPYTNKAKTKEKGSVDIQQDFLGKALSGKTNPSCLTLGIPSYTSIPVTNGSQQRIPITSNRVTPQRDYTAVTQNVLDIQRKIAVALKTRSAQDNGTSSHTTDSKKMSTSSAFESMFGSNTLETKERFEILETKSRFSVEAEQELYVQARQKITELEAKEDMKQKIDALKEKKKGTNNNGCIETLWKCQTCHQTFYNRPIHCLKSKHLVGKIRNIKKVVLTKNEERLKLTRKNVEDGGLVLGTGLNWSGIKDGSDSE